MNKKIIAIIAVVFFFGVVFGAAGKSEDEKGLVAEKVVEKTVEVEKNNDTWRSLKSVDDKGLAIAADNMILCSEGFNAIVNLDVDEMERVSARVRANTSTIEILTAERQQLLEKLGY